MQALKKRGGEKRAIARYYHVLTGKKKKTRRRKKNKKFQEKQKTHFFSSPLFQFGKSGVVHKFPPFFFCSMNLFLFVAEESRTLFFSLSLSSSSITGIIIFFCVCVTRGCCDHPRLFFFDRFRVPSQEKKRKKRESQNEETLEARASTTRSPVGKKEEEETYYIERTVNFPCTQ